MASRWRSIALSCVTATAIALGAGAILPREYTATARIVIDPPAGADVRAAVAVSPIYLESLRTYEQFAASDSLFRSAVERFGLRALFGRQSIEGLKKRVLKAALVHNTRILEISATLPDPWKAQALAQFVAESTVELNGSLVADTSQDLLRDMERQRQELSERLHAAESAWADSLSHEPIAALQAESENSSLLRSYLEQQLSSAELEIADVHDRALKAGASEAAGLQKQESNARARRDQIHDQIETLKRQDLDREKLLSVRLAHRDRLDAQLKSAQAEVSAIETQLREARGGAAYRGERLKIIDAGIVPEKPSSPNTPLNAAAAFLLGLVLPVVWFLLQMSYREQRAYHSFAKTVHE